MTPPSPEGKITLRDGRRLAYAEYGDPEGNPIFFFHGTPGSRLFHHPDTSIATSAGARIIAVDRPGFGRSDIKPGRRLLDWPNDIVQLADALKIDRFAAIGYSGGGPYAAVCASSIPDRLTAVGLVSSIAPLDNPEITRGMHGMGHTYFTLERHLPPLAKLGCWLTCNMWRNNPDLYFRAQLNGLSNSKEAQSLLAAVKPMLTTDFLEAVRTGTGAIICDLEILSRPWSFQLNAINTDVFLWHGEDDTQAPLAMGKRLASAIPHCRATFFPGEGHWAIYDHWREIVTALARAKAPTRPEPRPATIAIAAQDTDCGPEPAGLPENPSMDTVDALSDAVQGLQPAQSVVNTIPADIPDSIADLPMESIPESTSVLEGISTVIASEPASEKTDECSAIAAVEQPTIISPDPEPVQEAPKPVAKRASKRSTVAAIEQPTIASHKPEPVQEAPKPVAKKAPKHSTVAAIEQPATISSEPELVQEAPKPVAKKVPKRSTVAVDEQAPIVPTEPEPVQEAPKPVAKRASKRITVAVDEQAPIAPPDPELVQEAPKPVAKRASKRSTVAAVDSTGKASVKPEPSPDNAEASETIPLPEKAKAATKRVLKTKAAVVEPSSGDVPQGSATLLESPEPTPAKSPSKRKAAKEAAVV